MDNNTPNTNNFLNWVEIKNFKSIKDLRLDCKRMNIFIGKPNVGKSNILEGLGLLGASYNDDKYLSGGVRYNEVRELFRDSNSDQPVTISTDQISSLLERRDFGENTTEDHFELKRESGSFNYRSFTLSDRGKVGAFGAGIFSERGERDHFDTYRTSPIKKYDFSSLSTFRNTFSQYLLPPHGGNLYAVVDRNPDLWQEFAKLFQEQNLEFVLSDLEQSFVLQKKEGSRVKQYPYFSIADTFRRFMFYITAIESNKNSVIVFEEPEVHSFPPYTQEMAYRMIYDGDNQYFISTHSPYLLHTLIENLEDDQLNVYITYYENYETKVHALTTENLRDILDFGTDVFFNLDKFIPNAGRPVSA